MANKKHTGLATEGPFLPPPETPEEGSAILRAHGYDPDEVGAKMQTVADLAFAKTHHVEPLKRYIGYKLFPIDQRGRYKGRQPVGNIMSGSHK